MTDQVSKLVTRLQAVSRNGNGLFGELCGQAAAEILRKDAEVERLREARQHELTYVREVLTNICKQDGEGARESANDTLAWVNNRLTQLVPEKFPKHVSALEQSMPPGQFDGPKK